ncbi:MAG: STAS domain-containing protein [Lentisphaerota bacterium]
MSFKSLKPDPSTIIFKFADRMDTTSCSGLDSKILDASKDCKTIIFDLEGVNYISSSFLRLVSLSAKEVGVSNFSLIHVSPTLRKVLKISGIDGLIKSN